MTVELLILLTNIITLTTAAVGFMSLLTSIRKTRRAVNGELTELKELIRQRAFAAGVLQGGDEERRHPT